MGLVDAAEYVLFLVADDGRYRCPACGTPPIDWAAVNDELWSMPDEDIEREVLEPLGVGPPEDPRAVFAVVETFADRLATETAVVLTDSGPRCRRCDTRYDLVWE